MTPEERALLADLKMFDQADKTKVRDPEFKADHTEHTEIGPVDDSRNWEEVPRKGDYKNYTPRDMERVEFDTSSPLDWYGDPMSKALMFTSPAMEKAFWRKFFSRGGKAEDIEKEVGEMMNLSNKARDNLSTTAYRLDERKVPVTMTKDVGEVGLGTNWSYEPKTYEVAGGKDYLKNVELTSAGTRQGQKAHELNHAYQALLAEQEGTSIPVNVNKLWGMERNRNNTVVPLDGTIDYSAATNRDAINSLWNNVTPVKNLNEKFAAMKVKDLPKDRDELLAYVEEELNKDPLYRHAMEHDPKAAEEIKLTVEDQLELNRNGSFQTGSNGRFKGAHGKSYSKDKDSWGSNAQAVEGTSEAVESFTSPARGRWARANGINNENFAFPIRLNDSDVKMPELEKSLKDDGWVKAEDETADLVPKKEYKYKYAGPKYQGMLLKEVGAEKPAGRLHTTEWNTQFVPEVGDRYGVVPWDLIEQDYMNLKGMSPEQRALLLEKFKK